jgi:hypothetical protein
MRRQGRRREQLLDDSIGYWKLKGIALNCTVCRTRFGRGYESVVRQTVDRMMIIPANLYDDWMIV